MINHSYEYLIVAKISTAVSVAVQERWLRRLAADFDVEAETTAFP